LAASHGPGAVMPTKLPDIDPVMLLPWAKPFDDPEWMFELKYDGFRGLLYASASGCEIRSPQAHRKGRFTELRQRLAQVLAGRQAILEGDIVALDPRGKPVFGDLLRGRGYLAFAVSDLAWLDGHDLRALPLAERKRQLADLLPTDTAPLFKVFTLAEHGRALFESTRKMDLAGIVAKRARDRYGAETLWYTIRNPDYRQAEGRSRERPARRVRVLAGSPRAVGGAQ
jgi:bifunctional non-homologous end joining protein LigD